MNTRLKTRIADGHSHQACEQMQGTWTPSRVHLYAVSRCLRRGVYEALSWRPVEHQWLWILYVPPWQSAVPHLGLSFSEVYTGKRRHGRFVFLNKICHLLPSISLSLSLPLSVSLSLSVSLPLSVCLSVCLSGSFVILGSWKDVTII